MPNPNSDQKQIDQLELFDKYKKLIFLDITNMRLSEVKTILKMLPPGEREAIIFLEEILPKEKSALHIKRLDAISGTSENRIGFTSSNYEQMMRERISKEEDEHKKIYIPVVYKIEIKSSWLPTFQKRELTMEAGLVSDKHKHAIKEILMKDKDRLRKNYLIKDPKGLERREKAISSFLHTLNGSKLTYPDLLTHLETLKKEVYRNRLERGFGIKSDSQKQVQEIIDDTKSQIRFKK